MSGIFPYGNDPQVTPPPPTKVSVLWEDFLLVHVFWPLAAQLVFSLLFELALRPAYNRMARGGGRFHTFVKRYLGSRDRPEIPQAGPLVSICLLEMVSSLVTMFIWARNMYALNTNFALRCVTFVCSIIDTLHWFAGHMRGGFHGADLWSCSGMVDCFSIVPSFMIVFTTVPHGTEWLTMRYLRAYTMLKSYNEILSTGHFDHQGVLVQMVVLFALRIYCLVMPMSGIMMTIEILGDPQVFIDYYIETPQGDLVSPVMMINWVVVSIVTLGDGTFYPRTLVGRCIWSVFLVVAVAYVFYIQFAFGNAWALAREGSGAYRARTRRPHVVVFLQVKGFAVQLSSVVLGFLSETLNSSDAENWPDIVFFCESFWDDNSNADGKTLQQFLKAKHFGGIARKRVFFIVGQTSRKEDLERASVEESVLTYILPDINSDTPSRDDELNIFTALSLKRFYPNVRLRLMLLLPQSKEIAVQSGIMMERCFSVRELKAHLLAQNVRCHGILPLITGIFKNVDAETEALLRSSEDRERGASSPQKSMTTTRSPVGSKGSNPGGGATGSLARLHKSATGSPNKPGKGDSPTRDKSTTTLANRMPRTATTETFENKVEAWVSDYVEGVSRGVVGFELGSEYIHLNFGQIVATVFNGCGAIVMAVFVDGSIKVCPQDRSNFYKGQVFFAIAKHQEDLDPFRDRDTPADHWRETLRNTRDNSMKRTNMEGPHIAAAKLIGKQLQDVILKAGDDGFASESDHIDRQCSDDSGRSAGTEGALPLALRRRSIHQTTCNSMGSGVTGITAGRGSITRNEIAEEEATAAVESVKLLRRNVMDTQELVVVVVCQGEVWQQVRAFVSALRARYQPVFRPIVVLAPNDPPPRLFTGNLKERVLTLVGSSLKVEQLVEAGVLEAGAVVVMSGEAAKAELEKAPLLKDSRVVLCARMLECWCGISENEIFTTYELNDSTSVGDLPPLMTKPAVKLETFLEEKSFDDCIEEEEQEDAESDGEKLNNTGDKFQNMAKLRSSDNMMRRQDAQGSVESITFNMRFAAGQVLTPEIWGCMLGRMYYNPAVIELSEALVMPQRRGQRAFPWQIRPPKRYVGMRFEDVMLDLALGQWHQPDNSARKDIQDCQPTREGPAVALALYRKRSHRFQFINGSAEGTGGNHYLVLAPPGDVIVLDTDWLLVLGSRRFGNKALQMGLLRGGMPKQGKVRGTTVYGEDSMRRTSSKDGGPSRRRQSVMQEEKRRSSTRSAASDEGERSRTPPSERDLRRSGVGGFDRRISPGARRDGGVSWLEQEVQGGQTWGRQRSPKQKEEADFKECLSYESSQPDLDFGETRSGCTHSYESGNMARKGYGHVKKEVSLKDPQDGDGVEATLSRAEHEDAHYEEEEGDARSDKAAVGGGGTPRSATRRFEQFDDEEEDLAPPPLPRNGGMPFIPKGNSPSALMAPFGGQAPVASQQQQQAPMEAPAPSPAARRLASRKSTGFIRAGSLGAGGILRGAPKMASVKEGEEEADEDEHDELTNPLRRDAHVQGLPSTQHVFVGAGESSPSPRAAASSPSARAASSPSPRSGRPSTRASQAASPHRASQAASPRRSQRPAQQQQQQQRPVRKQVKVLDERGQGG